MVTWLFALTPWVLALSFLGTRMQLWVPVPETEAGAFPSQGPWVIPSCRRAWGRRAATTLGRPWERPRAQIKVSEP